MAFTFFVPTRVLFGAGQLNKLHKQALPGKKALIVISSGKSTRENGYLARVEEQLQLAGVASAVYDGVKANPTRENVMAGAALAREQGCDFVIGLGGGSSMDCAKSIAVMAVNPGDYWDYISRGSGKGLPLVHKPLPIVAITTTAGTGSECDAWTVITKEDSNEKVGYGNGDTFPTLSIVDPELMSSVPPRFTAYQGFDALFHSTEGYINKRASMMSDMYAIKAIELVGKYLARAVRDGSDMEAREGMAFANSCGGVVMSVASTTSEHSLEHALSAYKYNLPHGAGLLMISETYYTHFIRAHACDDRFVTMARALGMENAREPMDFITALVQLQKDCGVYGLKMSDYGIEKSELRMYAKNALTNMTNLFLADRITLTEDDCTAILEASYR